MELAVLSWTVALGAEAIALSFTVGYGLVIPNGFAVAACDSYVGLLS